MSFASLSPGELLIIFYSLRDIGNIPCILLKNSLHKFVACKWQMFLLAHRH